MLRNSAHG